MNKAIVDAAVWAIRKQATLTHERPDLPSVREQMTAVAEIVAALVLEQAAGAIEAEIHRDAMTDLQEGFDSGLERAAAIVRAIKP